jgi:hypothetical protein
LAPLFFKRSCTTEKVKPFIEGTSDFAFKKLFRAKEVLIPVLNDAFQLEGERAISDLDFADPNHPGSPQKSKATTFDLFCKTAAGERVIIEMQRVTQLYFYKRALYDWALEVTEQDKPHSEKEVVAQRDSKYFKKGDTIAKRVAWDYNFEPVYQFSVCDFPVFVDDPKLKAAPLLRGMIHCNGHEPVLTYLPPLRLCFMQLPNFPLDNPRASSPAEKIGTILKNLHQLNSVDELPDNLKNDPLIGRAVEMLSRAKLSREEIVEYEHSLKHARDEYAIQRTIEEKDRTIEEKDRAIEEKDRAIEELKRLLKKKDREE